jgi:hypothetical protein
MRTLLALLPETRNEQGFTETGKLAVRGCVHGTLSMLLDFKLKSVVLAARKEAQPSPTVCPFDIVPPPCLRAASNCGLSYGVSLNGSAGSASD